MKDSQVAYALMQRYLQDVRIKEKTIREEISPYSTYTATKDMLKRIRENILISGPELWVNSGFVVELKKNKKRSCLDLFEEYRMDKDVTYVFALMGTYSLLCFRRGASILKNALCVIPSFPAEKEISEIELTEKGDIERAKYPNWDDLDWQVYHSMRRDPNLSFGKVGGVLGVSWTTVQMHFEKILKDVDIWVSFYPKGYNYYQKAILKFNTKYEKDLVSELQKIDRSSFLYKYDENLLLYLFYEGYKDLRRFEILKKEGKIRDLSFSTPIAWD